MYRILCCLLLAAASLYGQASQAVSRLSPVLSRALVSGGAPGDSVDQALVDTMMSISVPNHQPSRQKVAGLADALRGIVARRGISDAQISALSRCIVDLLNGARVSNFALGSRVREELAALRVDEMKADLVVRRFMSLGEAVRGPDDSPVGDRIVLKAPIK